MKLIIDFLNNVGVNDPVNLTIMILDILCVIYIIKYYASKESRDERGLAIMGRSSFIAIIIYIVYFLTLSYFVPDVLIDLGFIQFMLNSSQLALVLPLVILIKINKNKM